MGSRRKNLFTIWSGDVVEVNHESDCYFVSKTFGFNSRSKYADVPSVTKPVLHSAQLPYLRCAGSSSEEVMEDGPESTNPSQASTSDVFSDFDGPHMITQSELNDLVRDLQLTKSKAELLGSSRQQWRLLAHNTRISVY
ncbi:hypothetical protein ILUMI_02281 [Ignelater luminosus]|uniref:Uncharacterized protein n=1 Tax=Ignelater luminosus TaxID=2038154 RepID=A0A8K0GLH6_IGNLU|nr:hypothetical protein ILUMI_02281 [Ignelater luminosus]